MVPRGEYRRMKSMYDEKGGVTNLIGNSKGASATINGYATKDGGEAKGPRRTRSSNLKSL